MNRILIRCLSTIFCLIFPMTSLFGMEIKYGTICQECNKKAVLTNIVNNSFQVNIEDASQFLDVEFQAFNQVKQIASEHINLLFHNGDLYINRFFPIHQAYEGITIADKQYSSLQVASLLGFNKNQIIAMQMIKENKGSMNHAAVSKYYSIESAWNEIRGKNDDDKKTIIQQKINECEQKQNLKWLRPFYISLYNFASAASILKYNITNKNFNVNTLNDIYLHAQALCLNYAKKIEEYISVFDSENTFMQSLQNEDILLKIQDACIEYKQYAHTEYMLNYHLLNIDLNIENVLFVSYYDMCTNCEELWATIAKDGIPTYVASYADYGNRSINRRRNNTPNLVLVYR